METNDKRILNRLRNWNRIPFRSLLETSKIIIHDVQLDKEFRYILIKKISTHHFRFPLELRTD
jgi:hypothetical protein